ncbi:MAG: hypothetical protein ABF391_02285 [Akkermansiaceae bacterium]
MMTRCLAFVCFSSSLLMAEPGEGHILSQKTWGPPAGMTLTLDSKSSLLNGKVKAVNSGSWSIGTTRYLGGQLLGAKWIDENTLEVDFKKRGGTYRRFLNDQRTNETQPSPLEGTITRLTKDGGKWSAKVVKGEKEDADATQLERELKEIEISMESDYSINLFGEQARKVGESWKVANPRLPWFNDEKVLSGEATVTFEKVEKVNGDPAAFLSWSATVRSERPGDQKMVIDFEGKGRVVRSLKHLVDYEVNGLGKVDMTVKTGEGSYIETVGKYELVRKIELFPIEEKE